MKHNVNVTSSRRKQRKANLAFNKPGGARKPVRKLMSAHLSKELREKHAIRALPLRKGDEVKIMRGSASSKGREGKVTAVYRKKFIVHVERVTRQKDNGQPAPIPIQTSNVIITKLSADKECQNDRKATIARKAAGVVAAKTRKATNASNAAMAIVD